MSTNVVEGIKMKKVRRTPEQEAAFQADLAARRAKDALDRERYFKGNAKLAADAAAQEAAETKMRAAAAAAANLPNNSIANILKKQFEFP
jgi:hypothetical protein